MLLVATAVVVSLCWLFVPVVRRHVGSPPDRSPLRFSHFGGYDDYQFWKDVIAEFEREHSTARIRQEYVVGIGGHYHTKMRQQVLNGTLPDVVLVQLGPFHELADQFAELSELGPRDVVGTPFPEDKFEPTSLQAFRVDGRLRALPVSGGNLLMYCNPDCFVRAARHRGVPVPMPDPNWTLDDLQHLAELLTCDFDGDGRIDQFGLWLPRWVYYLPFIWSFGADMVSPQTGTWSFCGPSAEEAMNFYRRLLNDLHVCPRAQEVPQMFQDVGFLTGRVAMCVNGPWFEPFLAQTSLADRYVVVSLPGGPGGRWTRITWDGMAIRAGLPVERRKVAERFLQFVVSEFVQDRLAACGRAMPSSRPAMASYQLRNQARRLPFVEALAWSRLQPLAPDFGAWDAAINRRLSEWLNSDNRRSANEMLRALASDPGIIGAARNSVCTAP